jgi:hypothetical protein
MAWAAAIPAAIGTVSSIFGGLSSASAARKAAAQARAIGRENEKGLLDLAVSDREDFIQAEQDLYWQASQFRGANAAHVIGSGLNAVFGSAAQAASQNAMAVVGDAKRLRDNSDRQTKATLHAAKIARMGGNSQARSLMAQANSANTQAITSAFTGLSSIASNAFADSRTPPVAPKSTPVTPVTPAISTGS